MTGTYKPEYVDPKDGKSLYTDSPLARHEPAVSIFLPSDILVGPFHLTKAKKLPSHVVASLAAQGKVQVNLSASHCLVARGGKPFREAQLTL